MEDSKRNNFEITVAELRKVEFQQKAILDNIPDIAWLKDTQGRFIAVNEPFARACGFRIEEIIGKTDLDVWPREMALSYRADDQEVMDSKKRKCVQERLICQDGSEQWIETIKTPFFDDQNKVMGTTGIARNITLYKNEAERQKEIRAELELRVKVRTSELASSNEALRKEISERKIAESGLMESEIKFRTMFEVSSDGMVIMDTMTQRFIYSNKAFCRMLGYSDEEVQTLGIKDIHPAKDLIFILKEIERSIKKRFFVTVDAPVKRKDGSIFYADISVAQLIFDSKKCLLGSFRDITERKKNENELKVYHEKLEFLVEQRTKSLELEIASRKEIEEKATTLHQQLEFILGVTKTGLDIIDKDFNLHYVDPVWACNYGNWVGKKCFEYFMERNSPCSKCAIVEAFRTKKVVVSEEILVKEGNRPIQVTTIPYQDKNGNWLVAEVNVDMAQKKKVDQELERYRNNLEEIVGERTQDLLQETNRYKTAELENSKLNRELIKINKKLKSISLIDAHTGLYNYRYLREAIEVEFHQARKYAQNLTVIMVDIDYFKSINDVYGMAFGDLVLKQLAKQFKCLVRHYDILIRYSGEEFIIISPRLNRNAGVIMAQRLLDSLNFIKFGNKKHKVKLKISLSVASFPDDRVKNGMDLVNLANLLLNKTKEAGGNCVLSFLDIKKPFSKGAAKISKVAGIKTLKNTINKLNKQSKQGLSESIFAFAKTLELKDHYTGEHVENTVHFAIGVAKELNLLKEDVELIKQAAMLHDLGKIGISENILLKKGKLNKKEFDEIKKHPQIGADIIRPIQFLHDLIPFIFYHHERWDGKGYPTGIKGEDIPVGARIIAIADVYQALISDRPYHKAFTKSAAIDIIKKASGTQFDPRIVSSFLKIMSKEK
jgi:diguanylate cyclase (GGDEF)-like protein/PAS domain S-box-containing protein/putative nucleotidyltransferase with HDIG domain